MIIAHELTKTFGGETVLDRLDLAIEPGGIHGLLGRNGVGKSTLLSIIGGQLKASGGDVAVDTQPPFDNAAVMDRTCLTGVDTAYPASWKLRDVLLAAAMRYPNWDQALADELIADFALENAMTTIYQKLSRGQRAMTAIVIGLASGAELLLLDEPYVGLDIHNTKVFYRHLLNQAETGRTVIMATHHIDDAAKVLDSALILGRDGTIAAHLTPDDADALVISQGIRTRAAGFDDLIARYLEES